MSKVKTENDKLWGEQVQFSSTEEKVDKEMDF